MGSNLGYLIILTFVKNRHSMLRNFDWPLFIAVLILSMVGVGVIYSATSNSIGLSDSWLNQALFFLIGLIVLFTTAIIDYRNLEMLALPTYLLFFVSLIAVALFGTVQNDARRWLNVGFMLIQPTEVGKAFLIIFMAWYLSWYRVYIDHLPYLVFALVILLTPLLLVYQQPDLGMTITYSFIGGVMILISGIRYWQLGVISAVSVVLLPFFGSRLQGYMVARICIFLGMEKVWIIQQVFKENVPVECRDPQAFQNAIYNVNQALIAVGSGGWLGQGWLHGSQTQGYFLRARHTDFIFSVIAEELGFIGAILILSLLFFIVLRLLNIANHAQDQFGRLIATGVAALIFFQTAINTSMNIGLMPVTGLTLPFVSYGGSSLLSMMFAIGLAQSVIMRHRKIEFV